MGSIELLLLGVMASAAACGAARAGRRAAAQRLGRARRWLIGGSSLPSLPRLTAARPALSLRPGAVVALGSDDYLCEGVLIIDDDGRATRLYRLVDGRRVRWLAVRPGLEPLLLEAVAGLLEGGTPHTAPDRLSHGGSEYRLTARAMVKVRAVGATGLAGGDERGWLNEYAGAAGQRVLALALGEHTHGFVGQPIASGLLELYSAG